MGGDSSEFEKKIMSVLSNPEALSGIMELAKGFGLQDSGNANDKPVETTATEKEDAVPTFGRINPQGKSGLNVIADNGVGLLLALKPFLSDNRAEKLDVITKLLKIAAITDLLK